MVGLHAEVVEHELVALLGEHAQHDGLAEGPGHGGHADVHLPSRDAGGDAPVLGQAALRDVDPRDELDAGGDGGESLHRLGETGVQHPVDPHPHREVVLAGLDVDVGGARVHGLGEQVVDQLDDRRLLGHLAKLLRAVAGVEVLDRALLAHEVEQAVDVVVGGEAPGHRLARVESTPAWRAGAWSWMSRAMQKSSSSRLQISTALSRNQSSLIDDSDRNW